MAQITGDPHLGAVGAPIPARTTAKADLIVRPGERRASLTPYLFLAIPIVLYLLWVVGPVIVTVYTSLTDYDGITAISDAPFVGLDNYQRLLGDRVFRISFLNNIKWLAVYITVPTVCGLGLAILLNQDLPGTRFFKAGFFSPMVLSSVVIANVWSWLYFPEDGLINATLGALGYDGQPIEWLGDFNLVTWAIIAAGVWRQIGYVMLLYLAGLKSVDPSLVDASKTDGANVFQSFRDVVLPQLQPVTVIVVVISVIDALRAFDLVNVMTKGGPANRSNVLANMMWTEAFNNYKMGYGAAIAVILGLISMVFIFAYLRRMVRTEMEY